jgi:drug/metabolite transporter (DMT)-like permease
MSAVLLIAVVLGVSMQSILKKPYSIKTDGKGVFIFNAIVSFFAMLFFAATSGGLSFNLAVLPYSFFFAITFAVASVFGVLAIANGSLSLTSLFTSFSLMIPTFYGLVFRHDEISVGLIPGIVLLAASLILTNFKPEKSQFSVKWLIFVFMAFAGNGLCSVVQSIQQIDFDRQYKNEFMVLSYAMVTVLMLIASLFSEKKDIKGCFKKGWYLAIFCGLFNGMVNLFVILLQGMMPLSVMFPVISAGGIVVTFLVSRFFYKEKLSKLQLIGFALGVASVILLNI